MCHFHTDSVPLFRQVLDVDNEQDKHNGEHRTNKIRFLCPSPYTESTVRRGL